MVWLAVVVAVITLAVFALVRYYEPQLAFFPIKGEDATPASYGVPFTRLTVTTSDGQRLRAWHLHRDDARARVVYFHGNGGNLSLWSDLLVALSRQRLDVVAFDYRGYGVSTGTPTEQGLYRDVEAVLALVHDTIRRTDVPLIYWGRSLGTPMAAYAATLRRPDGVILESGFPSMRAVVRSSPVLWALSWFASYEFPTARWAARTDAPMLVIHGDSDSIVPYSVGQALHAAIPGNKRFVTIKGGDHNDAEPRDAETYWRAVTEFVEQIARK